MVSALHQLISLLKEIHMESNNVCLEEEPEEETKEEVSGAEWWTQFVQPEHFEDMRESAKLLLLFGILKECEQIGDKVYALHASLTSYNIASLIILTLCFYVCDIFIADSCSRNLCILSR